MLGSVKKLGEGQGDLLSFDALGLGDIFDLSLPPCLSANLAGL